DDQNDSVARLNAALIIIHIALHGLHRFKSDFGWLDGLDVDHPRGWRPQRRRSFPAAGPHRHMRDRKEESERAALPERAGEANFAPKQTGNFAADGQAQAGAAVLAAGAAIGLLEGFEDNLLF